MKYLNTAKFLKEARNKAKVTQAELGTAMGYTSCHQYISNWERAVCPPPLHTIRIILDRLNASPALFKKAYLADINANLDKSLKGE